MQICDSERFVRAHVILCWLALLLIQIAETTTNVTWAKIADELDLLTLGTFTGPASRSGSPPSSPGPSATCSQLKIQPWRKKIIEATPAAAP